MNFEVFDADELGWRGEAQEASGYGNKPDIGPELGGSDSREPERI